MNLFIDPVLTDLKQLIYPINIGVFIGSLLAIIGLNFKFDLVKYNFELLKTFLKYLLSAFAQQLILILLVSLLIENKYFASVLAILLFSIGYHLGNKNLVKLTFLFSLFVYPIYFIEGYSVIYITICHALAGSILKLSGAEMRVWRFEWLEKLRNLLGRI